MKKNLIMRTASLLLVAVLVTSFFTGRRFARYTSSAVLESSVLVARYNVLGYSHTVNADGSIGPIAKVNSEGTLVNKGPFNLHNNMANIWNEAVRNVAFDNVYVLDANGEPDPSKIAAIDQTGLKDSRDSKVAPGTGSVSVLKIVNNGDVTVNIDFDLGFYMDSKYDNFEAKIVEVDQNGNIIANSPCKNIWYDQFENSENQFSDLADFSQEFKIGETRYYKLYWRWPYDTNNQDGDISLGKSGNSYNTGVDFTRLATYQIAFNVEQVD